jgi:type IV secretory pathway TrbL component
MKTLTIIYSVSAILILSIAALRLFHIYNGTYLILLVVVLVSFYQSSYITKLEKKIKKHEENKLA